MRDSSLDLRPIRSYRPCEYLTSSAYRTGSPRSLDDESDLVSESIALNHPDVQPGDLTTLTPKGGPPNMQRSSQVPGWEGAAARPGPPPEVLRIASPRRRP